MFGSRESQGILLSYGTQTQRDLDLSRKKTILTFRPVSKRCEPSSGLTRSNSTPEKSTGCRHRFYSTKRHQDRCGLRYKRQNTSKASHNLADKLRFVSVIGVKRIRFLFECSTRIQGGVTTMVSRRWFQLCFRSAWVVSVVYIDQLLGAARTQKLVEILFCLFLTFFSDFFDGGMKHLQIRKFSHLHLHPQS